MMRSFSRSGPERLAAGVAGFSLMEVVIAVGIFAVAVTAMLGLLPSLTRQSASSADRLNAMRLPGALRVELQRVALAGGFDSLVGEAKLLVTPLPETLELVAPRDAGRVQSVAYQLPVAADQIAAAEQYFLIEVWRFNDAPLAFETGAHTLALHARVSWPYRVPGSAATTPLAEREQIVFNLALAR